MDHGLIKVLLELKHDRNIKVKNKSVFIFKNLFKIIHHLMPEP
jgi:hypothetical protein